MWTEITVFMGWITVINFSVLVLSSLILLLFKKSILRLHSRMLSISEEDLQRLYVQYLSAYKILFLFFNLAPYLALKLLGF